jgi:hypothetical protein
VSKRPPAPVPQDSVRAFYKSIGRYWLLTSSLVAVGDVVNPQASSPAAISETQLAARAKLALPHSQLPSAFS